MIYKLPDVSCRKCGGETGMRRTCVRCGFQEFIKSLDDKVNALKEDFKEEE